MAAVHLQAVDNTQPAAVGEPAAVGDLAAQPVVVVAAEREVPVVAEERRYRLPWACWSTVLGK